jgi:hypothetical protein
VRIASQTMLGPTPTPNEVNFFVSTFYWLNENQGVVLGAGMGVQGAEQGYVQTNKDPTGMTECAPAFGMVLISKGTRP